MHFELFPQTVMGSLEHSLSKLFVHGEIKADGESYGKYVGGKDGLVVSDAGPGGGSGGTILVFVHSFFLDDIATISTLGGHGSPNCGGGGGGRIHFHWSDVPIGDEYVPMSVVKGTIGVRFVSLLLLNLMQLKHHSIFFIKTNYDNSLPSVSNGYRSTPIAGILSSILTKWLLRLVMIR